MFEAISAVDPAVVAQMAPGVGNGTNSLVQLGGSAVGAFLTTLVVGAILIAIVPAYTERMMTTGQSERFCMASCVWFFLLW